MPLQGNFFRFFFNKRLSLLSCADAQAVLIPVSMSATLKSCPLIYNLSPQIKKRTVPIMYFFLPDMRERPLTLLERDFGRAVPGPQQ